ncbi:MAG: DUF2997 domain-containing protein [Polyangiaceae bacterium]|nr:DUF2997 domain-containing protein [Polyangiaceae bacterium]
MKENRIVIDISHEGKITADAEGFTGDACLRDLERLLDGLSPGKSTVDRKPDDISVLRTTTLKQELGNKR